MVLFKKTQIHLGSTICPSISLLLKSISSLLRGDFRTCCVDFLICSLHAFFTPSLHPFLRVYLWQLRCPIFFWIIAAKPSFFFWRISFWSIDSYRVHIIPSTAPTFTIHPLDCCLYFLFLYKSFNPWPSFLTLNMFMYKFGEAKILSCLNNRITWWKLLELSTLHNHLCRSHKWPQTRFVLKSQLNGKSHSTG